MKQMHAIKWKIPTYRENGPLRPESEFGEPTVPVLICQSQGIRIVLGTHRDNDCQAPDLLIERHTTGWSVYIHPSAGDPSGQVFIDDDGRSFLIRDSALPLSDVIQVLER